MASWPLTAVLTNAQVVRRMLGSGRIDSAQMLDYLDKIVYNTKRASGIIERIRGFLRPGESGREAVEQIHWAQGRGMRIYAETCPQYVTLTEDDLARPGFEGAKCILQNNNPRLVYEKLSSFIAPKERRDVRR